LWLAEAELLSAGFRPRGVPPLDACCVVLISLSKNGSSMEQSFILLKGARQSLAEVLCSISSSATCVGSLDRWARRTVGVWARVTLSWLRSGRTRPVPHDRGSSRGDPSQRRCMYTAHAYLYSAPHRHQATRPAVDRPPQGRSLRSAQRDPHYRTFSHLSLRAFTLSSPQWVNVMLTHRPPVCLAVSPSWYPVARRRQPIQRGDRVVPARCVPLDQPRRRSCIQCPAQRP